MRDPLSVSMTSSESGSIVKDNGRSASTSILPHGALAISNPTISNQLPPSHSGGREFAISSRTLDSVKIAKVTLENFYNNLATQSQDRQNRYKILECMMESEGLTEDQVRLVLFYYFQIGQANLLQIYFVETAEA